MNVIILNTQEILSRLEEISQHQAELVRGLQAAQGEVYELCNHLSTHLHKASQSLESIERCQAATAYYAEQTQRQMEFVGWLHLLQA